MASESPKRRRTNQNDEAEIIHVDEDDSLEPASTMIPSQQLPAYLADAFSELYEQDGLLVLAKGLGWLLLLASFVRFYADTEEGHLACVEEEQDENGAAGAARKGSEQSNNNNKPRKPPLVLVLGLKEVERNALVTILQSWGTPPEMLPTILTNESGQSKDRQQLYQRGGVFCVTSRILIVDLLTKTASPDDIDGFLVAHAENVTEQSTEAFILRIFQSQKQPFGSGFCKAFTDAADQVMSGFAKVDKILKALHVRRLYLYPRFQHEIRNELERYAPRVTEEHQSLSPLQKDMQMALAAAVQSCIRELKSSTTLIEWSETDLTVENCVTTNFDQSVSRQLEQDWHRLHPKAKQLVQDLRTLRTLFTNLIHYDCVSFWKLINSIRTMSAASRHPSLWLLTPAADMLFRRAKERVYKISQPPPTDTVPNPVAKLETVLEENPKWTRLKDILGEIRQDNEKKRAAQSSDDATAERGPTTVLVMVKDDKTVETLNSYLVDGKSRTLQRRWIRFLEQYNDKTRSVTDSKGGTTKLSEESRLLFEEEGRIGRILFGTGRKSNKKQKPSKRRQLNQVPDYVKKRRRIAKEKGRGDLTHQSDDLEREAVLDEAVEVMEHDLEEEGKDDNVEEEVSGGRDSDAGGDDEDEDAWFKVTYPDELRVVLQSHSSVEGDRSSLVLNDLEPDYIVVYDPDVAFVRAVEMYAAVRASANEVRVFFLVFEASAEEKKFTKALEREQSAFEKLIQHKKTMPPPVIHSTASQEMQHAMQQGSVAGTYMGGTLPLAVDTRRGRGKANTSKERRDIAVDVREFRSALPSILHQGGMRLAPVTLIVGDFILSNVHCVERKSISDLYGSFASGRLYSQAEAMCKYYKCPCLLIEFDPKKSFSLQNASELGGEIRTDSICSKMALLTMHFPQLRILWSRSPHETLRLFRELKVNHEEVDVDKAMEIGRNESVEGLLQADNEVEGEDEINEVARDILLRLPGVTVPVARKIMESCESLSELSELSQEELRRVAGPAAGQKLFTFFRTKMETL